MTWILISTFLIFPSETPKSIVSTVESYSSREDCSKRLRALASFYKDTQKYEQIEYGYSSTHEAEYLLPTNPKGVKFARTLTCERL